MQPLPRRSGGIVSSEFGGTNRYGGKLTAGMKGSWRMFPISSRLKRYAGALYTLIPSVHSEPGADTDAISWSPLS